MKYLLLIVLGWSFFIFKLESRVSEGYDNFLLVKGQEEYNSLICDSNKLLNNGDFDGAIEKLVKASKKKFHESPNYRLDSTLAQVYLLKGDITKANYYIDKSTLVVSLLSGIAICDHTNPAFPLVIVRDVKRYNEKAVLEVSKNMCSDAYSYIYNKTNKSLAAVALEGKLAEHNILIRKKILEIKNQDKKR